MSQTQVVEALAFYQSSTAGSYAIVISAVVLVYDYFIMLDREISYIFTSRHQHAIPRLALTLFILNRYLPFIDISIMLYRISSPISPEACLKTTWIITTLLCLGIILAECILALRVHALWDGHLSLRPAFIAVGCMMALGVLSAIVELCSFRYQAMVYPGQNGCHLVSASKIAIFNWILLLICETTMAVLTLVKVAPVYHSCRNPLVSRLFQDGIMFYCYLVSFTVINISIQIFMPPAYANIFTTPQRVLHSVLCTRVMLVRQSSPEDMDLPSKDVGDTKV